MLPVPIPISIMIPTIIMMAVMGMVIMVLMPIVVRILPSRFHAGSAVTNGSPRGSLRKSGSVHDVTAGSGKAMMRLDCTDVKLCT